MRCVPLFALTVVLCACDRPSPLKEMALEPGRQGTFLAVMTETANVIEEPATPTEPEFKFRIRISPKRGISIGTAVGGEGQADLSEAQLFTPASITKVITASVALKRLGTDFTFKTRVSWQSLDGAETAKDLTIRADGDPTSSKARLREIVSELKSRGIKRITGKLNLFSVDRRKDQSIPAHGLDKADYWSCYGSRAQNFNLARNCSTLTVSGWDQARWADGGIVAPVRFDSARTEAPRVTVTNELENGLAVRGYVVLSAPAGPTAIHKSLPVPDVKSWYGNALATELRSQGIDISQASAARDLELPATDFFEQQSPPLDELTKTMNKFSDNWLAEALYKASAVFGTEQNINEAAASVVQNDIAEWLSANQSSAFAGELMLYDGAGLSRANKVTPRAFLSVLKALTKEKWFPALWDSLPIAGVDGTLRGRMKAGAAGRLVRAKTGTLKGAYQLAGYIPKLAADGVTIVDYIPFVLLTATTPQNQGSARAFQDKLLSDLTDQINQRR